MSGLKLSNAGFSEQLVSVIPPDAKLSNRSTISPEQRGKTPGRRNRSGTWGGYPWLETVATEKDVKDWDKWGANIGLRSEFFPAVDIDVNDAEIAKKVAVFAREVLGSSPIRLSREPRLLLVFRTEMPFGKLVLKFERDEEKHLIEILGAGQQFLVHGRHPKGVDYRWRGRPLWEWRQEEIPLITKETATAFLTHVRDWLQGLGYVCDSTGSGNAASKAPPQDHLLAPSGEAITELVKRIHNPKSNSWDDMVRMGCSLRAAGGDQFELEAWEAFSDWCSRWEGGGDPDGVDRDKANWDSFRPPFRLGWSWLQEQADSFGHCSAADEFQADPDAVPPAGAQPAPSSTNSSGISTELVADGIRHPDGIGVRLEQLKKLNEMYAVVQVGADVVILQEREDSTTEFMKPLAFGLKLANVLVPEEMNASKNEPLTKAWTVWPGRRQYDRVVFKPGVRDTPNEYNLWRGWGVEPNPDGDCSLFIHHLLHVVCNGDKAHTRWILDWMAHIFQNPCQKPGTVVGLQGRQGAGKSIVGAVLKELLGRHQVVADKTEHVVGRFNEHLAHCLLLQCEEAFWGGSKAAAGALKHLVTGTHLLIERKGIDSVEMENYTRLLITSNEDQVWPTSIDDRRLAIFRVLDDKAGDDAYFDRLFDQMRAGGYGKLLHVLMTRQIDTAALRKPPTTDALMMQASEAMSAEESWLLHLLETGEMCGKAVDGGIEVAAAVLYDHYKNAHHGRGFPKNEVAFGVFVGEHLRPTKTKARVRVDTRLRQGVRSNILILPALGELRELYGKRGRGARQEWRDGDGSLGGDGWTVVDEWGETTATEAA